MLGLLCAAICLGASAALTVQHSFDDDDRRQRAIRAGFDTYIDHKGVQRHVKTGNVALKLWNENDDRCLIDMKTGQVYRNYDAEKREEEQKKIEEFNNREEHIESMERFRKAKLDYARKYVYDPSITSNMRSVRYRPSDGLELADNCRPGQYIRSKHYNICLQIFTYDYTRHPQNFMCMAADAIRINRYLIDGFDPKHDKNPLGFKSKEELEAWVIEIGGLMSVEDSYNKIGAEVPDYELGVDSLGFPKIIDNGMAYSPFSEQGRKVEERDGRYVYK